ncbi:YhbD family protein [Pullulanibacillus sp. KACC 23026]|uniref:YhbD family protein n=1 Tax=Pullulanibacillus sp. KACC 23026 TaxID=3028315 RepID=UPI0023B14B94|nr:YhbD family protein [Pullulanibacillus sp. KACC 23026]WEG12944.1 YhbD family protein [Pullulanibacillus sp. KACC 23026]
MTQDLISKKDLLEATGISYGQLYRWKRKNLIPEDWFIRKSTFTGQETFFPKDKILERIEKIQTLKDDLSLDDLASMFSPNIKELNLGSDDLLKRGIASQAVLSFFLENAKDLNPEKPFSVDQTLYLYILESMLESGNIQLDEGRLVLDVLEQHYPAVKQKDGVLLFLRKLGVSICLLVSSADDLFFDKGTKVVMQLSLLKMMEELKAKLM